MRWSGRHLISVGYWVQVSEACEITVTGTPYDLETMEVTLPAGWSHIGYPGLTETDVAMALGGDHR